MTSPTLLFLPGNMCDATLWRECTPILTGLAIAKPVPPGQSISEMAAWCLETYEGPLLLIGFSMGGIVALECLRQKPDRIHGIVLIATNPGADRPDRAPVRQRQQEAVKAGHLMEVVKEELMPVYFAPSHSDRKDLVRHVADMAEEVGSEVFVAQSEALRLRDNLWSTLDTFTSPALVLCGEADQICPPALHETIATSCANASLKIVPDAGHMLPIEQPSAVRSEIEGWLEQFEFSAKGGQARDAFG